MKVKRRLDVDSELIEKSKKYVAKKLHRRGDFISGQFAVDFVLKEVLNG